MSRAGNRNRAKFTVTFVEAKTGTPLDVSKIAWEFIRYL